jgi:hypothetical protein
VNDANVLRSAETWVLERDRLLPVAGLKIKTLEVRLRVDGREFTQVLQMPSVVGEGCR